MSRSCYNRIVGFPLINLVPKLQHPGGLRTVGMFPGTLGQASGNASLGGFLSLFTSWNRDHILHPAVQTTGFPTTSNNSRCFSVPF